MLPAYQALHTQNTEIIKKRPRTVFVHKAESKPVVYKIVKDSTSAMRAAQHTIRNRLRRVMHSQIPGFQHRDLLDENPAETESTISRRWTKARIPTPQLLERQQGALVYEYVKGQTLERALHGPQAERAFRNFLDLHAHMRWVAFAEDDSRYLHPDHHPENYLVRPNLEVLAIDPGLKLKYQIPIEDIDAHLNAQFLARLYASGPKTRSFMQPYVDRLTNEEQERLVEAARPANIVVRAVLAGLRIGRDLGVVPDFGMLRYGRKRFSKEVERLVSNAAATPRGSWERSSRHGTSCRWNSQGPSTD